MKSLTFSTGIGSVSVGVANSTGASFFNREQPGNCQQGAYTYCIETTQATRMFTTSATFSGNLGGVQGANQKCQAAADSSSRGLSDARWVAFVADSTQDVRQLFPTGGSDSLLTVRGTLISFNPSNLCVFAPDNALGMDENGALVSGPVWTGGGCTGTGNTCSDWTSTAGMATVGTSDSNTDPQWENSGMNSCSATARLYCIEQQTVATTTSTQASTTTSTSPSATSTTQAAASTTSTTQMATSASTTQVATVSPEEFVTFRLYARQNCSEAALQEGRLQKQVCRSVGNGSSVLVTVASCQSTTIGIFETLNCETTLGTKLVSLDDNQCFDLFGQGFELISTCRASAFSFLFSPALLLAAISAVAIVIS